MEVHHTHHPTHKKKWSEYLLEFLMLFLAVFMGFIAENIRQDIGDRRKEKQYMVSLLSDLKNDTAAINTTTQENLKFLTGQDSLADVLNNLHDTSGKTNLCYRYFALYTTNISTVQFNDRTMSQLLNAGNMRLIEKPGISDSIMNYNSYVKGVEEQQKDYEEYSKKVLDLSTSIFDITYARSSIRPSTLPPSIAQNNQLKLLTTDAPVLKKYVIELTLSEGIEQLYVQFLNEAKSKAAKLITVLKKEYGLKDE